MKFAWQRYDPRHPCLHQRQKLTTADKLRLVLNYATAPLLWPLRLALFIAFMLLNSLAGVLLNIGTTKNVALPPWRRRILRFCNAVFLYPALLCAGFILRIEDRRSKKNISSSLILCNHHGLTDILCLGALGTDCMIANKKVTDNVFCKPQMKATRSISPGNGCVEEMRRRKAEGRWPVFTVFADGVICPGGVVLRPKIGCLRLLDKGDYVQPLSIKYHTPHCISWLIYPVSWVGKQLLKNNFRIAKIVLLEPVRYDGGDLQEFADKIYMNIADAQGEQFQPYGQYENRWFEGLAGYTKDGLSAEYLRRYAWMGDNKNYRGLCAKAGRDPYYEWTAKQLNLE